MKNTILKQNKAKRLTLPFSRLLCFALFNFWQMGFIYFVGPSLTLDGKTPLPIDMDNATVGIVLAYVCSIVLMAAVPQLMMRLSRAACAAAAVTMAALFLPLPVLVLKALVYAHVFFCCFLIGTESFIVINFLSEKSAVQYLTLAYGVSLLLIAAVQNDFLPLSFPVLRAVLLAAILLLFYFYRTLPAHGQALPQYVKKGDGISAPKKLLVSLYIVVFVSALMAVSGPAIAAEVKHGVFFLYLAEALTCFGVWLVYKRIGTHPFRVLNVCLDIGGIGFLLMFICAYLPQLALPGCICIGVGMVPCIFLPLYGAAFMAIYPSRFIPSVIIGMSMAAVVVQSVLVELFRTAPVLLNMAYAVIVAALATFYREMEPKLFWALHRPDEAESEAAAPSGEAQQTAAGADLFAPLTRREREVAELIIAGYSNADIANTLVLSAHTVNDHTKNIYRKLDIHSRMELVALSNQGRIS